MRLALAIGLAFHGLIHLIGFVVPSRLADVRRLARVTTAFGGRLEPNGAGGDALRIGWLLGGFAYVLASVGVLEGASWAEGTIATAAAISLVLCIAGAPEAAPGIAVNVAIVAAVLIARATGTRIGSSP